MCVGSKSFIPPLVWLLTSSRVGRVRVGSFLSFSGYIEIAAKRKTRWSVSTRGRVTGSLHDALRGATYLSVPPPPPLRAKAHHYCSVEGTQFQSLCHPTTNILHKQTQKTRNEQLFPIRAALLISSVVGIRQRDTLVNRLHDSQRNCCTYRQLCGWGDGIETQVQIPRVSVVQYLVQRVRCAILLRQCILFHY